MKPIINSEERDELHMLLDDVIGTKAPVRDWALRLHELLLDAEQAGRGWASEVRLQAELSGLQELPRRHKRQQSTVIVPTEQASVVRSTVAGVRRIRDGSIEHVQEMFVDLTWDEFDDYIRMIQRQILGLLLSRKVLERVEQMRVLAPTSRTIGEAAAELNTTVEAWIEQVAS